MPSKSLPVREAREIAQRIAAEMNVELVLANIKAFLPKSVFPDNFINVVDESLAGCKFDGKTTATMADFNATLSRMAGVVIV